MTDSEYFLELFKKRRTRVRRTCLLLMSVCALLIVNFWHNQWEFDNYYFRLPVVVYEFSGKYHRPLVEWWDTYKRQHQAWWNLYSLKHRHIRTDAIPFHSGEGLSELHGVSWNDIPLLSEHLDAYLPTVRKSAEILGWKLDFPLYLFLTILVPTIFVLWIAYDLWWLCRIRSLANEEGGEKGHVGLVLQSVLFDRITKGTHRGAILRSIGTAVALWAVATIANMLGALAPLVTRRFVEGTLYTDTLSFPHLLPTVQIEMQPPSEFTVLLLTLLVVNVLAAVIIANRLVQLES